MWDMNFLFILLITGATTKVTKFKEKFGSHTRNTFNRFPAMGDIKGTSHIIRTVLRSETCSLSGGDRR